MDGKGIFRRYTSHFGKDGQSIIQPSNRAVYGFKTAMWRVSCDCRTSSRVHAPWRVSLARCQSHGENALMIASPMNPAVRPSVGVSCRHGGGKTGDCEGMPCYRREDAGRGRAESGGLLEEAQEMPPWRSHGRNVGVACRPWRDAAPPTAS